MSNLGLELKTPITKGEGARALKEMVNGRTPQSKVVIFDLGPDDATNVRVYDFLKGFMDESRIIVATGLQRLAKYHPMPRVHDYIGVNDLGIRGLRFHGEKGVKSAFYSLAAN